MICTSNRPAVRALLGLWLLLTLTAHAQEGSSPADSSTSQLSLPESLDRFIEEQMAKRQIPGLALAIARKGAVIAARGYGVADVQNGSPVTPETRFELASVTKPFTAAGIMLLVQEGRIDLDAPIRAYVPEVPESWAAITVRHLLNHTSGFPYAGALQSPPINITNRMWFEAVLDDPLDFDPGTQFQYSDRNYRLLGIITERVSGMSWREFMPSRVFTPLGMRDTYVVDRWRIHKNEARNYTLRDGELVNDRRVYQGETPSHAGMFSNVLDLAKWDAALHSDGFLGEASRKAMWSHARLTGGVNYPYGLGWALDVRAGRQVQWHGGVTGTVIVRFPQDELAVIVLTNFSRAGAHELAMEIAEMVIPELRSGLPLDPAEARRYAGEYVNERGLTARVFVQRETLHFIPPRGKEPVELVYQGGTRFKVGDSSAAVEFLMGAADSVTGLVVYPADYTAGFIRFDRD